MTPEWFKANMALYQSGMEAYMSVLGGYTPPKGSLKPNKELSVVIGEEELKTLIYLCHPDKHGGKEVATRMTQMLLDMRGIVK
jgi:hypothetical protein